MASLSVDLACSIYALIILYRQAQSLNPRLYLYLILLHPVFMLLVTDAKPRIRQAAKSKKMDEAGNFKLQWHVVDT